MELKYLVELVAPMLLQWLLSNANVTMKPRLFYSQKPASRKSACYHITLVSALAVLAMGRSDAIWITNFTSVTPGVGGSASGVWRDVTVDNTGAGIDTGFAVNLATTGEMSPAVQPADIGEGFPWRDIEGGEMINGFTAPFAVSLPFAPQVNGDFPNIETEGMATSVMTFSFGAVITNPVLSFSDLDVQTTLMFNQSFTVLTSTGNLSKTGNNLNSLGAGNSGTNLAIFGQEAAGSIQFTGDFTGLTFSAVNVGPDPDLNDDRTGYVVTTESIPVAIPEPSTGLLAVIGMSLLGLRRRK